MALASTIVWEVRPTTATNADNGGGFNSAAAGTDRSKQPDAQTIIDNSAITCTTPGANSNTLTFTAGYTPSAADVGNIVAITAGTNINAGLYEITGQNGLAPPNGTWTVAGAANLTTAGGAGSAITGRMGGARSGFNNGTSTLQSKLISGHIVYVKNEAWNEAVTINVAGTCQIIGYNTTRGDTPTGENRPCNDRAGAAGAAFVISNQGTSFRNIVARRPATFGFSATSGPTFFYNCRATACGSHGFQPNTQNGVFCLLCEADGCTNHGFNSVNNAVYFACVSHNNSQMGFSQTVAGAMCLAFYCVAFANTQQNFGLGAANAGNGMIGCTSDRSTTVDALVSNFAWMVLSCILSNAGTYGGSMTGAANLLQLVDYNDFFANTTADRDANWPVGAHDQALDPQYTDDSLLAYTDLVIDGSNAKIVTSAASPFTAADVGRFLQITGGTGFVVAGSYIRSVDGSNKATLEYAAGTTGSTGGTGKKYGTNFAIGTNVASLGWPSAFPG